MGLDVSRSPHVMGQGSSEETGGELSLPSAQRERGCEAQIETGPCGAFFELRAALLFGRLIWLALSTREC
jgi:hypothetical protein